MESRWCGIASRKRRCWRGWPRWEWRRRPPRLFSQALRPGRLPELTLQPLARHSRAVLVAHRSMGLHEAEERPRLIRGRLAKGDGLEGLGGQTWLARAQQALAAEAQQLRSQRRARRPG